MDQVLEYFENGETEEVLFSLEEMLPNLGARRWMVASLAIELSMDHKPSHRWGDTSAAWRLSGCSNGAGYLTVDMQSIM